MMDQNTLDTAHLLRRAGFGADTGELQAAARRGLPAVTDDLLHPERTADPLNDDQIIQGLLSLIPEAVRQNKQGRDFLPVQVVKMWWTIRMLSSPHPLVEKMTLFWHGHFTSKDGATQGDLMMRQNQTFRANALGNFRTLTLAVARDPEMLRYLNGNQNFKAHPNENFGRELMELYTCGIGNYTEDDVKAAARAFSGWNVRGQEFFFNARQHDDDPKTFLGKTGDWNGDDVVDILVAHPATARRLCTQLWAYFAYPDPEPAVLNALVRTYYASGYDIRAVLGTIFRSRAFYSPQARNAVIKSPAQYVIGSVKMLGLTHTVPAGAADIANADDAAAVAATPNAATPAQQVRARRVQGLALLSAAMRSMGQDLFEPPSVKGWDGNADSRAWINTATLLARVNFANTLSQSRNAFNGEFVSAVAFVRQNDLSPAQWVDYLADSLGPLQLTPRTRQALIDYVSGAGQPPDAPAPPMARNTDDVQPAPPAMLPGAARPFRRGLLRPGMGAGAGGYRRTLNGPLTNGLEGRLRGVIPLIMATPEFQTC